MATTTVNNATLRKQDQFDIQCLDAGGKTLAVINVSVDTDGKVRITYATGNKSEVVITEAKGE